jgi:hypothetical protein
MLKRQRYPFRARDHGDVLEVAAQSLTRQETLATPSLTFDLNEHQARQSFRCAASYVGGLLPPIGRCYRNPATEYRPNAGDVLPVSVGIKRDFSLHRYPPGGSPPAEKP